MRIFTLLLFIIFVPFSAQATWIQYDKTTGAQTGTNSQKVNDAELAALGKAQIQYDGPDPHLMMVDVNQKPPAVVTAPPPPTPPADMETLIFDALVQDGKINPAKVDPAIIAKANASLAVTGAPLISR
jgi:hypothetical protein